MSELSEQEFRKGREMPNVPDLVIVTGMSGAGRTEAMHAFEDLGYFCVDNLPASMIGDLFALEGMPGQEDAHRKMAVVCDARNRDFFPDLERELGKLTERGVSFRLLFLDASDEKLLARYKSSRRRHPLCDEGMTIVQGILRERSLMFSLREAASDVIDTTDMLPQKLRSTIRSLFSEGDERSTLAVTVYSFGFKHGAALDADLVMDVRFLPNPFYDSSLRHLTGLDESVRDYVLYRDETVDFQQRWRDLLDCVMPGYVTEGKQQLAIAIGCTGGQHRSVAIAESTGEYLKSKGYRVSIAHRDLSLAQTVAQATEELHESVAEELHESVAEELHGSAADELCESAPAKQHASVPAERHDSAAANPEQASSGDGIR